MDARLLQNAIDIVKTPLYLFEEGEFHACSERLREALPEKTQLCYAIKANSFIVEQAARDAERIEVCSPGELRICQVLAIPAEKLVISGVYKDESFLRELISGWPEILRYTAESTRQFDLLEKLAAEAGVRIPLLIRLACGSQFGIDAPEVKELVARCKGNASVEFFGIQLFAGTQKTSAKRMRHEIAMAEALIGEIEEELDMEVREFEYGAGLPVAYFESDEDAWAKQDAMASTLRELLEGLQFDGDVVVELGRAMAASCGTYATRIVDAKCNGGNNFAIVDGGKHQMVYYGNAMGMSQPPCALFPEHAEGDVQPWNICGSLCTTTDIIAKQLPLQGAEVGDVIAFRNAGAYCMTEGVSLFLSRDLPAVVIADQDGNLRLARDHADTFPINTPGHYNL